MAPRRPRGRPPHSDVLTPAEWRVVEAVRHGMSNPAIARRQGVSLEAVKFHVANALSKLGLASRAELRRWDGVRVESALKRKGYPDMTKPITLGPLVQISRIVSDIEAAKAWYGSTLGLELIFAFPGMAFFKLGEARLYLQEGQAGPESILYFRVDDIHAAHRQLDARGVTFDSAPHMIHRQPDGTESWLAAFKDPDGRPLQLMAETRATVDA